MLNLIERALRKEQIKFQRIDGKTSLEQRRKAKQQFEDDPDCMVMLASISSCAEGYGVQFQKFVSDV
jgi:SNF2 family DNA or RNA helicase